MSFWQTESACASGVLLSILVPCLARAVRKDFRYMIDTEPRAHNIFSAMAEALEKLAKLGPPIWTALRPYALLAIFSLAVSILIVAFLGDKLSTWQSAMIAGYLWDSTLQKLTGKP